MRALLFTDTLADVNGVARFVSDVARLARERGRDLTVVTSTRAPVDPFPNVINIPPRASMPMPGYPGLALVAPPVYRAAALVARLRPDVVHVSTPGPVGWAGRRAAILAARGAASGAHATPPPALVGTYHTDFPAYVGQLFDDEGLGRVAQRAMRWFYAPFTRVLARSAEYARRLTRQGLPCWKVRTLQAGTDTERFHPRHADPALWERLLPASAGSTPGTATGVPPVRLLVVGRVSVEKNLPMLADAWTIARASLAQRGLAAELVLVGDGPYLPALRARLGTPGSGVHFLGFRTGAELSAILASGDALLFPSATDTLGQVALEAQAAGLAVLVGDIGGPREVIRPGRTGWVLPHADAGAWAAAIVRAVEDGPTRRAMGAAARAHVEGRTIGASFEHFWTLHQAALREHLLDLGRLPETPAERARRLAGRDAACNLPPT
jgi:glycosyltransferase involved in cell wall biosynthesis